MTQSPFPQEPEYGIRQTDDAVESRRTFADEQLKALSEIMWNLSVDPSQFAHLTSPATGGLLVYRHPAPALELTYRIDEGTKVLLFTHFSAPLPPRQTIFVSYSHLDRKWLTTLRKYVDGLEAEGKIKVWDDRAISPGERWEDSIQQALEGATVAVLLVSQDFLRSKFITTVELPRLLRDAHHGGKKIFWIHLSPSTVFEEYQEITQFQSALEDPRNKTLEDLKGPARKRALLGVYRMLRKALED